MKTFGAFTIAYFVFIALLIITNIGGRNALKEDGSGIAARKLRGCWFPRPLRIVTN
jgi:hypothetical protein